VRAKSGDAQAALNRGIMGAAAIMFIASYPLIYFFAGPAQLGIWYATVAGLISGVIIGLATEYYTSAGKGPVDSIAQASQTGAGTTIITGLAVGMKSTFIPVITVGVAIIISFIYNKKQIFTS
jgi:K(+)-stimulated pyrophosphate-energized sodium pump